MFLKIKTPAKINLTLDVLGVRDDGYHEISSIMQTISLYDYLTFELSPSEELEIVLSGSLKELPYNEKNLVYKAIKLLYSNIPNLTPYKVKVYIEKNIPTEAGLGGGSSNAAGAIWAMDKLLNLNLSTYKINELCAMLGSDLNVCYWGGANIATSRGEVVEKILIKEYPLTVIKPLNFGISAKEGYQMFDTLNLSQKSASTVDMLCAIRNNKDITPFLHNDLEIVPMQKFPKLSLIKQEYPKSIMTGSGSACFILGGGFMNNLPQYDYAIYPDLTFVSTGIEEA